jgi:hypothetical protein
MTESIRPIAGILLAFEEYRKGTFIKLKKT